MATSAANGPPADTNGSIPKLNPSAAALNKQSFAARMSEVTRKADEEGPSRRTTQPPAWTSGVNPITQRASSSSQVNGVSPRTSTVHKKLTMDRQAWVYANAVGLECNLVMKSGQTFSGVFVGVVKSNDELMLVFKMVKDLTALQNTEENTSGLCGQGPDHKMVVAASSVQTFDVPQAPVAVKTHTANGGFRTDADISGNLSMRERNLQRWEAAPSDANVDLSLESSASAGSWDQFKVNEQQFGLKSDYDENLYTTTIDRKNPLYAMREREAERIAREIEGTASTNAHIREERGIEDDGADEEERYSGVRRDFASLQSNQPGRYVPPSRRSQVTVEPTNASSKQSEGPVDPAIIASQIARAPELEAPKETQKTAPAPAPSAVAPTTTLVSPGTTPAPSTTTKDSKLARDSTKPSGSALTSNNIEQKVLDSFHQFSAIEKIKVQHEKRNRVSADKAVRINDLMKFSKNFKLLTPVPKDLVPILAKDENKQKAIVQKAQQNAESTQSSKVATLMEPQKAPRAMAPARYDDNGPATAPGDRTRQPSAPSTTQSGGSQAPIAPASLSAKLTDHHRAHKAGTQGSLPTVLPITEPRKDSRGSVQPSAVSSPQKAPSVRPPGLGAKLNVKAMEFKPTAAPFKPGSGSTTVVASSPRSGPTTRTLSPAAAPPKFFPPEKLTFGKPEERLTPASVAKQKRNEPSADTRGADGAKVPPIPASQGGFQFPYRTPPTWTIVDNPDTEPDYKAVFNERRPRRANAHQAQASPGSGIAPHYPMPPHMPGGAHGLPHIQAPHHNHQQMHQQPHYGHPHQYDDHHMRPSASNSSHFPAPSPRMHQPGMAYPSPMPGQAQMVYPQQMQYPMQTPPMGARTFSNGPPMGPMPGGHLAPMMMPQHSAGGFMPQQMGMPPYNGQVPVYPSPGPQYGSPSQSNSGFPSPGRGAPMMIPQNSQQGQQPMFMPSNQYGQPMYAQQPGGPMMMRPVYGSPQPNFGQHPYGQHQYPQQIHRTPSQGYAQPHHTPQPQHAAPQQGPPPSAKPADMGEEVK